VNSSDEIKLTESQFAELVRSKLDIAFQAYKVSTGACLLYKLHMDSNGKLRPSAPCSPVRGQLAFETDVLIQESQVPLVAIELKFGGFTTHDILTYSMKASRHKEIYPYLRYGLVVGGIKKIHNRFFTHNSGFDFALMFSDHDAGFPKLIEMVGHQIELAQRIRRLADSDVSSFETLMRFS
jgi:hypothetical protein